MRFSAFGHLPPNLISVSSTRYTCDVALVGERNRVLRMHHWNLVLVHI